jgi:hypothetical protein
VSNIQDKFLSDQQKSGLAIIVACLVDTLAEFDPTLSTRFLERISVAREKVRNSSSFDTRYQTELLMRIETFLTGWSDATGQGKTFL